MRHPIRLTLAALALATATAAAAHAAPLVIRFGTATHAPDPAQSVPVLDLGTAPPHPYRVLAVITIENTGPASLASAPDHAYWAKLMQAPAKKAGAEAVIGLRFVQKVAETNWVACALAVEYTEAGAGPDTCGCVAAISTPVVRTVKKDKDRARLAEPLQTRLWTTTALAGWYPIAGGDEAAKTLGHAADAHFTLVLDSLPPQPVKEDRSRRVTSDDTAKLSFGARCTAALVTASGDTVRAGVRDAHTDDFAALGDKGGSPMGSFPTGIGGARMTLGISHNSPDAPYWRAIRTAVEPLPGPARGR